MTTRRRVVALFGGSFDPPHVGHVLAVTYLLSSTDVDGVWVIPVYAHAFGKALTPYVTRHRLCELAFGWLPRVHVDDIERELGGESRTLTTIQALQARHPDVDMRLVIGSDVLGDTPGWHRFDRVAALAPPLVLGRVGHPHPDAPELVVLPDVSSRDVRSALARGMPLAGRLPRTVEALIRREGLYGVGENAETDP
ncbi:MAG: nicotinate-nicotinamide nucleotide adenylyltransferase [Myxococcota bacterium]